MFQHPVAAKMGCAGQIRRCGNVRTRQRGQAADEVDPGLAIRHIAAIYKNIAARTQRPTPRAKLIRGPGERIAIESARAKLDTTGRAVRKNVYCRDILAAIEPFGDLFDTVNAGVEQPDFENSRINPGENRFVTLDRPVNDCDLDTVNFGRYITASDSCGICTCSISG